MNGNISRRNFIKTSSTAVIAGSLFPLSKTFSRIVEKKSRVVLVRNKNLFDESNQPRPDIVRKMLDDAVTKLFDGKKPSDAWREIVKPSDMVGIKTNAWKFLSTPPQLESALKWSVVHAGVPEENISVLDHGVLDDPIFKKATALINVRPMRTHHWAGVGTLIKNYIQFVEKPSDYHDDSCANLGAIWNLPHVKDKTRLNILVMFTPLFYGVGPHNFNPEYTWRYNGLLIGLDPVAVDSVGMRIITAKRKEFFKEDRPINPSPKHIELADTRHGIGRADQNKIELLCIGWNDGRLI